MLHDAPQFDIRSAERLAREHYALDAAAHALPSERDQNFLLESASGERYVLKIANAREDRAMLEAQQAAMAHLATRMTVCPRVVASRSGASLVEVAGAGDRRHHLWMITCLPGVPLARVPYRSPDLLEELGRTTGTLATAMSHFDHPAVHREFYWDLARGPQIIAQHRPLVADAPLGAAIDALMERFNRHTAPLLPSLPRAVVHNDLNDHNVLVQNGVDPAAGHQRIVGIVDFGDMVHGYAIADLAVAGAYVMLDTSDPLSAAAHLVRGYVQSRPLTEHETSALFGLMVLRLCTSACVAAFQLRERPDNEYLRISQDAVRRILPRLTGIPFALADAAFRHAQCLEPSARGERVRAWLRAHTSAFAAVMPADLRTERCLVLDLSVGSPMVSGDASENTEPALTPRVFGAMREAGVRTGVGRYDEPRLLYIAPAFVPGTRPTDEHRTIHLGLDLFDVAGSPVHAPMEGIVHALADNRAPQDYGPVIILRHETEGVEFFTLYGHLSRESLTGLRVGQRVERGEQIATLGAVEVNGGWTPHLHLQIIVDLMELGTDFPGVALPSQRALWTSFSPDPNLLVGIPEDRFPLPTPAREDALAERGRLIGGNLSIAYREPLRLTRGWMQYLYDDEGRTFLDAYNNVPHVGHCHPRVVQAGQRQMAILNTNTRYLSDQLNEYSSRLAATLPTPLEVCYFLNSASEANELALRLARAHTRQRDMIVLEAAYHGHTNALIDLSPYKHAGPGGVGAPDWVHAVPLPDDYRGEYRRGDPDAGPKYARHVADAVARVNRAGRGLAGFIAETCPSVGGQLMLPEGYLRDVYRYVRAAGGVCIADEVQTGLGRIGTHFWAFEAHDVVPDIVVMGKPLGNGHPMAALITTRAIAESFDNGMEFFSTFGGNNVSCAIGIAVLDVLRDQRLQAHALRVGERLLAGLRPLVDRYPMVGDVRGSGLFLGVELVRDRNTLEPAGAEASYVANRMREEGILLGTDGAHHNVVKIRPPMPFNEENADLLVATLERVIAERYD